MLENQVAWLALASQDFTGGQATYTLSSIQHMQHGSVVHAGHACCLQDAHAALAMLHARCTL